MGAAGRVVEHALGTRGLSMGVLALERVVLCVRAGSGQAGRRVEGREAGSSHRQVGRAPHVQTPPAPRSASPLPPAHTLSTTRHVAAAASEDEGTNHTRFDSRCESIVAAIVGLTCFHHRVNHEGRAAGQPLAWGGAGMRGWWGVGCGQVAGVRHAPAVGGCFEPPPTCARLWPLPSTCDGQGAVHYALPPTR